MYFVQHLNDLICSDFIFGMKVTNDGLGHFWAASFAVYTMLGIYEQIKLGFLRLHNNICNSYDKIGKLSSDTLSNIITTEHNTTQQQSLIINLLFFQKKIVGYFKKGCELWLCIIHKSFLFISIAIAIFCLGILFFGIEEQVGRKSYFIIIPFVSYLILTFIPCLLSIPLFICLFYQHCLLRAKLLVIRNYELLQKYVSYLVLIYELYRHMFKKDNSNKDDINKENNELIKKIDDLLNK
jgi:hypothetical protein